MTVSEQIKAVATGWAKYPYGLPSEVLVQDWRPTPLCCARWVVVLTHTGYSYDDAPEFLGEFYTRTEANRVAGQYRRHLHAVYDAARAKRVSA